MVINHGITAITVRMIIDKYIVLVITSSLSRKEVYPGIIPEN